MDLLKGLFQEGVPLARLYVGGRESVRCLSVLTRKHPPRPHAPALGVDFGGPSGTALFGNVTQHDLGKDNLTFISSGFRILTCEAGCSQMVSQPH